MAGSPITEARYSDFRRFARDGDRAAYEAAYFARRRRLYFEALSAMLDPTRPVTELEDLLWSTCYEPTWALPAHLVGLDDREPVIPHEQQIDLFAAETGFALAEISELLAERLDPVLRARIAAEVRRRVLLPFLDRRWFWEELDTNWSAVCAAGVGMAALYLLDDDEELATITRRCVAAMQCFLSGYGNDGVCREGIDYWAYGFGNFAVYAQGLRQHTDGRVELMPLEDDKISNICRFPERIALGGRAVAAFADSEPLAELAPAMVGLLAARCGSGPAQRMSGLRAEDFFRRDAWGLLVRAFLWSDAGPVDVAELPPSEHYFEDAQWLVVRRSIEGFSLGLAAKGGHNAEPHNHNDLGSFVLAVNGEPFLAELGTGFYTRHYFSDQRYETFAAGSQGHSLPIIDGTRQHEGLGARAEVIAVECSAHYSALDVELSSAYGAEALSSYRRKVSIDREKVTLIDEFQLSHPVEIMSRLISFKPFVLTDNGAEIVGHDAVLELIFDTREWSPELAAHPHRNHDGESMSVYSLDLRHCGGSCHPRLHISTRLRAAGPKTSKDDWY